MVECGNPPKRRTERQTATHDDRILRAEETTELSNIVWIHNAEERARDKYETESVYWASDPDGPTI
jgi:hypothetical protein